MPRKSSPFPIPKLDKRGDSWRIRWFSGGRQYDVAIGATDQTKARVLHAIVVAALAGQSDWPPELVGHPVVVGYLRGVAGAGPVAAIPETADALIDGYYHHQKAKLQTDSRWPDVARGHLRRFFEFVRTPNEITTASVSRFLDVLASMPNRNFTKNPTDKPLAIGTRNAARSTILGLFRWMRKMGMRPRNWNPMEDIGRLRDAPTDGGIIVWPDSEVPALLEAADKLPDGVAVWIGVLAGLRRGEISRLAWDDVTDTVIVVRAMKTGRVRQVPLSKQLAARLAREKRTGECVVPWPKGMIARMGAAVWLAKVYLPRQLPDIHAVAPEQFGWNPFRHTFASRLAQRGHSLELISAWMGNTPRICRTHYARFVPADRRDTRIDDVDV